MICPLPSLQGRSFLLFDDKGFQFWSETHLQMKATARRFVWKLQVGLTYAPQNYGHDGDHSDIPGSKQIQNAVGLLLLRTQVLQLHEQYNKGKGGRGWRLGDPKIYPKPCISELASVLFLS